MLIKGTAGIHLTIGPLRFDEPPVWFAVIIALAVIAMAITAIKFINKVDRHECGG